MSDIRLSEVSRRRHALLMRVLSMYWPGGTFIVSVKCRRNVAHESPTASGMPVGVCLDFQQMFADGDCGDLCAV